MGISLNDIKEIVKDHNPPKKIEKRVTLGDVLKNGNRKQRRAAMAHIKRIQKKRG